ncbi:MAG: thioredoxin domain-containing protein [Candidatus Riflebacteria bacterium]|nr:thioredoxin domain-containing protein [Candidatus Riflebacteria bacterium]
MEKSPYLLQHAYNPVDWYPWTQEAFEKARKENKPIFLSIGYSTCHWCHVMEHESFENVEVANILNGHFVSIKVDREERPDLDQVYMTYVQSFIGGGGWPMSVWLTPDIKPFMGGTYFPPNDAFGKPGFISLLEKIARLWKTDSKIILDESEKSLRALRQMTETTESPSVPLEQKQLEVAYNHLKSSYDQRFGGFGGAPKFPMPAILAFMLRYYSRTKTKNALDMSLFTLRKMAEGGMFDQIGGGFHRYSVDKQWHVPHFEKMLYDQGQLACLFLEVFQITHEQFFAQVARKILNYVRRDMTGQNGEFFSAEDADSLTSDLPEKKSEGAFYVWENSEIIELLGPTTAAIFSFHYGIKAGGNVLNDPYGEFPNKNIFYVTQSLETTANHFETTPQKVRIILDEALSKLFEARLTRHRPHLDDKTITAWNGLMISGFARAYQVLHYAEDLESAVRATKFIRSQLFSEVTGTLFRRYRDGQAAIPGFTADYAFLIQGLLDLYEASFDDELISWAIELQKKQDELFWDDKNGGYFNSSKGNENVLLRLKDYYDGAEPSVNSVSVLNLLRLALLTENTEFQKKAEKTFSDFSAHLTSQPQNLPLMLSNLDFQLNKLPRIIIVGNPQDPDTKAFLEVIHQHYIPNKILMVVENSPKKKKNTWQSAFISTLGMSGGKATAYVCVGTTCQLPTNEVDTMLQILGQEEK